jgi:hypothetical protein
VVAWPTHFELVIFKLASQYDVAELGALFVVSPGKSIFILEQILQKPQTIKHQLSSKWALQPFVFQWTKSVPVNCVPRFLKSDEDWWFGRNRFTEH